MTEYYRMLGVTKNATKEEIKEAFRKLAIQFHPDKHAQSSKPTRDAATLKFKQVSEAYEVLADDRKRAAYNLSRRSYNNGGNFYSARSGSYNNANYNHGGGNSYYNNNSYQNNSSSHSNRWALNMEAALRYMNTREFLRNLTFASILLFGTVAVEISRDTLWKTHNAGKSFEEAMDSVQKNKVHRDKE